MTEDDWVSCTDPHAMLAFLQNSGKVLAWKQRLLVCAFSRQWWYWIPDERSRNAVVVSECFVDGLATEAELFASKSVARAAANSSRYLAPAIAASTARASGNFLSRVIESKTAR